MRIFIDTNVMLDVIQKRKQFFQNSSNILIACRELIVEGIISPQSVPDIFYILRKDFSENERRKILLDICQFMTIETIDSEKILLALANNNFVDLEDCLQAECAVTAGANYIITRNTKHFAHSPIPAITPEDFCQNILPSLMQEEEENDRL